MDDILLWFTLALLLIIPPFIGYKMGRGAERKDLTDALAVQIQDIYMEGYGDGGRSCNH
jgi:hypothetical protein